MLFVIVKIVQPDAHVGCSDIKSKLENMKMSQFKHDITKTNLQISEQTNEISIAGGNLSRNDEDEIQHLLHLIMNTLQGLHVDQDE